MKKYIRNPLFILFVFALTCLGVIAAGNLFAHSSYVMEPTAGYAYSIDLTGSTAAGEIIPGGSFSIDPAIKNTSTGDVYTFVRISCPSYQAVVDGPYLPIYELTISDGSAGAWTVIDSLSDATATGANIVVAYGSDTEMTTLEPDDSAQLTGSLKLNVSNTAFKNGVKDDLNVTIHGLAVHMAADGDRPVTGNTPADAYAEYMFLSGE